MVKRALAENKVSFQAHGTTYAGEATTIVRAALKAGERLIAVVGGDGTLSETAEGFFDLPGRSSDVADQLPVPIAADATLAILPAGTGDDFARGLLNKRADINEWLHALVAHCQQTNETKRMRTVDVIYGNATRGTRAFICLNAVTLGLGAEVAESVAAQSRFMRRLPGEVRFVAAALNALIDWRERLVRVTIDERDVINCSMNLLAITNGIYAGGGMMLAPAARPDDGKLDLLLACGLKHKDILRELQRIRRGEHLANAKVQHRQAQRVRVDTFAYEDALPIEADGNVRGYTPAEFCLIPRALHVLVP